MPSMTPLQSPSSSPKMPTEFPFITFKSADDFKSQSTKRTVRSHVVKHIFEHKKSAFRRSNHQRRAKKSSEIDLASSSLYNRITTTNCANLDPFECIPVDQSLLGSLLCHPSSLQAVEPVFSISSAYSFQTLDKAYDSAFTDPAFVNALMCATLLAKNGYSLTPEVMQYKGRAIDCINQQLASISTSSYECTIGAILLLAGVDWRVMSYESAQIHLRGIEGFLHHCKSENRAVSASVQRGIFWQDVNTAAVSGTGRVLDTAIFPNFQCEPTTFTVDWARLPPGFKALRVELGDLTMQILQDICVLQKFTEALIFHKPDITMIHKMDGMQASIEVRLLERLQDSRRSQLATAVLLAAYLYTYSLFTQIWNSSSIPLRISARTLIHLQSHVREAAWVIQEHVILWCVVVAGSLTPKSVTRTGLGRLLQMYFGKLVFASNLHSSWFAISGILDQFLWSQSSFGEHAIAFLKEYSKPEDSSRNAELN